MATKTMLGLRVGPDVLAEMDALAKATKRSRAWIAEEAVRQYCAVQNWQIKEIVESIAELKAGVPTIPNDAMISWLSSWGTPDEKSAPNA